jgi:hypothetical protein
MSDRNRKDHFVGLKPWPGPETFVVGIGNGKLKVEAIGIFIFDVEDEYGRIPTIQIPNSVYVPGLNYTLICPQHWTKEDSDVQATQTYLKNGANGSWMVWNHNNNNNNNNINKA